MYDNEFHLIFEQKEKDLRISSSECCLENTARKAFWQGTHTECICNPLVMNLYFRFDQNSTFITVKFYKQTKNLKRRKIY